MKTFDRLRNEFRQLAITRSSTLEEKVLPTLDTILNKASKLDRIGVVMNIQHPAPAVIRLRSPSPDFFKRHYIYLDAVEIAGQVFDQVSTGEMTERWEQDIDDPSIYRVWMDGELVVQLDMLRRREGELLIDSEGLLALGHLSFRIDGDHPPLREPLDFEFLAHTNWVVGELEIVEGF